MAKRNKNKQKSPWLAVVLGLGAMGLFVAILAVLIRGRDLALLNPKGLIAEEQYKLFVASTLIMLGFGAIVLFFIYFFAWRYRESNQKNIHNPHAGRSKLLISTAWAAPLTIFVILASLMLPATQRLEPQRSIEANKPEMTIRVVALRWKWLFLYPEHDIATVNFVQIPVDTPVRFELTADEAPMQSFWIPHLGGMLYAMTEHVNPLNLLAHEIGDYTGGAAEINGSGFAGMRFVARVSTQEDFDAWVSSISEQSPELDEAEYNQLLEPSEYVDAIEYRSPTNKVLFDNLLNKYAGTHSHGNENEHEEGAAH